MIFIDCPPPPLTPLPPPPPTTHTTPTFLLLPVSSFILTSRCVRTSRNQLEQQLKLWTTQTSRRLR